MNNTNKINKKNYMTKDKNKANILNNKINNQK